MIRSATPQDAQAIAEIWNQMIRDTLATFTTVEKTKGDILELLQARPDAFWVAAQPDVVGFATFGAFRSGPGYQHTVEHTVILSDSAHRQGIGRALLNTLENAARAQGKHVLVAGISSANPRAVAFHAAMGFTPTAEMPQVGRKDGQWLDLILMQKTLSAS